MSCICHGNALPSTSDSLFYLSQGRYYAISVRVNLHEEIDRESWQMSFEVKCCESAPSIRRQAAASAKAHLPAYFENFIPCCCRRSCDLIIGCLEHIVKNTPQNMIYRTDRGTRFDRYICRLLQVRGRRLHRSRAGNPELTSWRIFRGTSDTNS